MEIILKQITEQNLNETKFKKRTLKKLIMISRSKTSFSFDHVLLYKQTDGMSMGSSLAPVLANIILTEFEKQLSRI